MPPSSKRTPARILLIDDNPSIHEDFRKILTSPKAGGADALADLESELFGAQPAAPKGFEFEIESAFQGEEGLSKLKHAAAKQEPYSMAFVDMRMPPGWDGLETICQLWKVEPELQVVICTAYSDYSWSQILQRLERQDGLLILKKPFDSIEVQQMAQALSMKSRLQQQVKKYLLELETLVADRTRALSHTNDKLRQEIELRIRTEEQLVEARKLEGLGHLAAGIAHEINNPMAFVTANVEHLQEDLRQLEALPSVLKEYVEDILPETIDGIVRVNQIVADVKRFARGAHGDEVDYSLNAEVQAALSLVKGKLSAAHRVDLDLGQPATLRGKRAQITQVVQHLLLNAIQATPQGGHIAVRTYQDGEEAVLEVRDDGPGMTEVVRAHLFDPFFTTKDQGQGKGLGLSVSYGIVKSHWGRIEVESAPGKGAKLVVRLPTMPKKPEAAVVEELAA